MPAGSDRHARGPVRGPRSLVGGLLLVGLAALALTLTRDLGQGTLRSMGPGMVPRALAIGLGLCGLVLVGIGLVRRGHPLDRLPLRGPVVILLAITAFALTIRPFPLGDVATPGLGLLGAGPLTVVVGGFASPEARLRENLALGLGLTAFAMLLFGDLLNLPIPMFPEAWAALFPAGWSQDGRVRVTAGLLAGLAAALLLAGPRREAARADVAGRSGGA
ncbi:tripartite tricarboxylate transporter TctB family protein [Methylobacterium nonmethylotrophicum]|uniref:Tripartite tricarboxylate transporter TctB family protein n=1 Tax=Methylobacterium nonmethylotrophicum TaxID=1141884 RepID=A0A4Z0NMS0_9HYPH|nr:tripartite tricarboxylate transporter TctB family protein [Methylobacterium nonmethylotrophicum]TGD97352.1 tripartite tricarboxylate transporter TctB family protein [Methylobacterium nonmethylotrophicum]